MQGPIESDLERTPCHSKQGIDLDLGNVQLRPLVNDWSRRLAFPSLLTIVDKFYKLLNSRANHHSKFGILCCAAVAAGRFGVQRRILADDGEAGRGEEVGCQ